MNNAQSLTEVLENLGNSMSKGYDEALVEEYLKTYPQYQKHIKSFIRVYLAEKEAETTNEVTKETKQEIKEEIKLELFRVGGGTFQVRVNGEVDNRFNDYLSATGVMMKARLFYPDQQIHVPFELKQFLIDNGPPIQKEA